MLRKYIPTELAVNIVIDDVAPNEQENKSEEEAVPAKDPKDIDFNAGLNNVGGMMSAFGSVVNAFYKEGMEKLELVPRLLADNDLTNYITEVHALKSSSAAIGATAMSVLFRELEFAGKANNIEFIEGHTESVMDTFVQVLEVIKRYLEENGLYESQEIPDEPKGEETVLDDGLVDDILNALTNFNINETESKVNECVKVNYGSKINSIFREVKSMLDVFDYHKAKELLMELKKEEK